MKGIVNWHNGKFSIMVEFVKSEQGNVVLNVKKIEYDNDSSGYVTKRILDEIKRLTEKYDLNKVPEEKIPSCIAQICYEAYVQWKREEEELFANDLLGIS